MPLPTTKQELADWILRRLGAPVINVEIADVQLEDAIDKAVQWYQNWHYDGSQRSFRTIKVTQDMLNGNKRLHQDLTAPMFDPLSSDDYRVGDRVMTYKPNGSPDSIWVRFDSDERLNKYFFTANATGEWFQVAGTEVQYEGMTDSDNGFVAYDSDLHNFFIYFIDSIVDQVMVGVSLGEHEDASPSSLTPMENMRLALKM